MKKRKRCVNCQFFNREKVDEGIGICRKYGFTVRDTLSGCAPNFPANHPLTPTIPQKGD